MKLTLTFFLAASVALAGFMPNVRVDHEERPCWSCESPAIAVGPGAPSSQPLYVVFQDESLYMGVRDDIMFQKSTDAGRTWLPADVLIRRGSRSALNPDITTDSDGNVYIVYEEDSAPSSRVYCVRSSDGGATWTAPTRVDDHTSGGGGSGRIVADSAGRLFVAWNHGNPDDCHIFSSVSTDRGATWSPSVRVCDDTVPYGCYSSDVSVQPGTNHYLVAATAPRYEPPFIVLHAYLYRSTDMGLTFQPGVQLDTFDLYTGQPHVVADRDHIICDYTGDDGTLPCITEARTFYTQPDTWGGPVPVTDLDTLYSSYYNGAKLAISADGRVHTALMIFDLVGGKDLTYYASSSDHGVTWSNRELINDDTTGDKQEPDIGANSAGHAYVVWRNFLEDDAEIWFSTNNPAGVAEGHKPQAPSTALEAEPSVFRV